MTDKSKIEVPNLEATSDGKRIFAPKKGSKDFDNIRKENTKWTSLNYYVELN